MKNGDEMINDDDEWNDNAEWQWITRLSRNDDFCIRCDCRWMQWSKNHQKSPRTLIKSKTLIRLPY